MNTKEKFVITVSREIGSGGRTVGRKLAERLGVYYSDKDLIRETEDKLKAAGAWNAKAGAPIFKKNEEGVSIAAAVVGQDVLNEYNFQVWYDRQPFGSIISGLKRLLENIASDL